MIYHKCRENNIFLWVYWDKIKTSSLSHRYIYILNIDIPNRHEYGLCKRISLSKLKKKKNIEIKIKNK